MDITSVGKEIQYAVSQYFKVEELLQHALEFIKCKVEEGFSFGNLTLLHYHMFGGNSNDIYRAAAAIELMILSLDILDDLQDQDDSSRPWTQMDSSLSLNIATGFLLLSTQILHQTSFELDKKNRAIDYLNRQVLKAVNGQHTDLLNSIISEHEYIQMVKLKSGSLVAAACVVGTALATDDHHHKVKEYAEHIGIVAQIKNDMKDFYQWDEKSDLMCKKKTLPILYVLQNDQSDFKILRDYYEGKLSREVILTKKLDLEEAIRKSGVLQYSSVMMRVHQLQAMKQVKALNVDQEWKEKLIKYI